MDWHGADLSRPDGVLGDLRVRDHAHLRAGGVRRADGRSGWEDVRGDRAVRREESGWEERRGEERRAEERRAEQSRGLYLYE